MNLKEMEIMDGREFGETEEMDNSPEHYNSQITYFMNISELEDEYDYDFETNINSFFWEELLPILFVYSFTFILGLIGNILIIFTTFRYRKMKSTTNVFLASLATADLLLIVFCIPVKRRSARYALEWLECIRPDPRNFKLEKMEKEKLPADVTGFVNLKPFEQSISKLCLRMENCSAHNLSKCHEDFKGSRKIGNNVKDLIFNYHQPCREEAVADAPSRNLIPANKGQIFRYKEEQIELLSMDETVPAGKAETRNEDEKANLNMCRSLLQPFFNEKKSLRNAQNSFKVNEMNREAVVIYRRKGHGRIDDWKNYRIEEFTFGKTKFGLTLDAGTRRSFSETRGKTHAKKNSATRRRRNKFHYEPVKLGRSVSIEFKKFDEIREMFHPEKLNPVFQCGEQNNSGFWESSEFRLRSSAEKKLNLFREMKKVERNKRKKFQDTLARSLNYRCAIAESIKSIFPGTVMGNEEGKEISNLPDAIDADFTETSAAAPISLERAVQQHNNTEVFEPFSENTTRKEFVSDCLDLSGTAPEQMTVKKTREIFHELIPCEGLLPKGAHKELEKEKLCDGDSNLSSLLVKIFGKELSETSEMEQLILRLKEALKERSGSLETDNWDLMKLEEELQNIDEKVSSGPVSLIAYPVSTDLAGMSRMKKLKSYTFHESSDGNVKDGGMGRDGKIKLFERTPEESHNSNSDNSLFNDNLYRETSGEDIHQYDNLSNESTFAEGIPPLLLTDPSINGSSVISEVDKSGKRKKPKIAEPSRKSTAKDKPVKNKISPLSSPKYEPTSAVEKRIISMECRLKELLRRIGVYPTKEQEAIKKCLERLKETSEAVLRRMKIGLSDSSKCGKVDKMFYLTQRGYQSEPESAVKINKGQESLILKTSKSEIQLNVGMEITMENFDPVTGEKLRPEENRNFEQQGNIQCKLIKPGEKPVTFINANFLYNPETGMLFKGCQPTNQSRKNEKLPLKPTKTYLFSKIIEPKFASEPEENTFSRKKSKIVEFNRRDSSEESKLSSDMKYALDHRTPSEKSKSAHSDEFRTAIEREERKNKRYLDQNFDNTSESTCKRPVRRNDRRKASLLPTNKSGINFSVQATPEQSYYLKQISQGKIEKPKSGKKAGIILRARDKSIQANLTGKKKLESEVKKSTGVQAGVKTKGKVFINRGENTFSNSVGSDRQKMVNVCMQTLPPEQSHGRRKNSEVASQSQSTFITDETQKYLKDLETQKRLAKLFSYTWSFGFLVCKLVYYMQSVSAICSVLTLAAMSVERYYAIIHPMRAQYVCTISQARKIITVTWISSLFLAIPVLFAQIHMPVGVRVKGYWCVRDYDNPTIWRAHETYMLLLILVIPTSVMGVAYTTICLEIWHVMERRQDLTGAKLINVRQSKSQSNSNSFRSRGKEKKRFERKFCDENPEDQAHVKQAIKMLVAVVVIFVVCWTPFLIDNLLQAYGVLPYLKFGKQKNVATIFHLMAYFNSCINPIIYGFMSKNFRESFRKALCCSRRTGRTSMRHASVSNDRSTSIRYAESRSEFFGAANEGFDRTDLVDRIVVEPRLDVSGTFRTFSFRNNPRLTLLKKRN